MTIDTAAARGFTGTPVRSYANSFDVDDAPLSDGGMWLNGGTDGVDWVDVIVKDGKAYGGRSRMAVAEQRAEQGNLEGGEAAAPMGDYDDPTAILAGEWGPDQHGRATVYSVNPTDEYFQEVEIRLRSTMDPKHCRGYEVFWRCLQEEGGYAEIVRWNGPIGDFTSLKRLQGAEYGVKHGDVIEATVIGNVLTGYVNGVEMISVTDDVYTDGAPGIGFNFGVGDTNVDHGLSSFEVDTYDPA
jgi:hypothetical protein